MIIIAVVSVVAAAYGQAWIGKALEGTALAGTTAGTAAAAAGGAAIGSVAGQAAGVALGVQNGINFKQVGISALTAGITQRTGVFVLFSS